MINDSALCFEIPASILSCAAQIPFSLIPLISRNLEANDEVDLTGRQNRITPVCFLSFKLRHPRYVLITLYKERYQVVKHNYIYLAI